MIVSDPIASLSGRRPGPVTRPMDQMPLACGSTPVSGCQPAAAQKALLALGNGKLGWKWTSSILKTGCERRWRFAKSTCPRQARFA